MRDKSRQRRGEISALFVALVTDELAGKRRDFFTTTPRPALSQ
jgi:hypothetical protein